MNAYLATSPTGPLAELAKKWVQNPKRLTMQFAPEFSFTSSKGDAVSLASVEGKTVLIDFWATWCPPCRESVPELKDLHEKFGDKLLIISVSADEDESKWAKFVADHKMDWIQYFDKDKSIIKLFGVRGFPTYMLIDKEGAIRATVVGLDTQRSVADRLKKELKPLLE